MKGVILAAGVGKRLRPLTETKPKVLMPVLGRRLIEYPLEFLRNLGVDEVVVVVGYMAEEVSRFVSRVADSLGLQVSFAKQDRELGTGHAVKVALRYVGGEDAVVVYGDLFLDPAASKRLAKAMELGRGREVVLGVVEVDDVSRYARVVVESGRVKELVEKPAERGPGLANAGVYYVPGKYLELVEELELSPRGEYEFTDVIVNVIRRGEVVRVFNLGADEWMDVGVPWLVIEVNKLALAKWGGRSVRGEVEGTATVKGPVIVEEGARIRGGSYIEGPAYIGEDADIGPNSYIRPYSVIGRGCRIGFSVEVKESVVFEEAHAAHLAYIGDSVVGEHVNLGAGTILANLRFDERNVKVNIEGKRVDSGRRKLGAIIGGYVKTGVNVSIMPGVKIGSYAIIYPGVRVFRDVPSRATVEHDWL